MENEFAIAFARATPEAVPMAAAQMGALGSALPLDGFKFRTCFTAEKRTDGCADGMDMHLIGWEKAQAFLGFYRRRAVARESGLAIRTDIRLVAA